MWQLIVIKNRVEVRWKKKYMHVKYFAYLLDELIYNTRLANKKKKKRDCDYIENCITTILQYQILVQNSFKSQKPTENI